MNPKLSKRPARTPVWRWFSPIMIILMLVLPLASSADYLSPEQCMNDLLISGDDALTLGEIRAQCSEPDAGNDVTKDVEELATNTASVTRRLIADREAAAKPFSILAHKPNYVLAGAYNAEGWDSDLYQLTENEPEYENKDVEAQFQISLKVPLAIDLFGDRMDIYAAYTNRSFWQVYNHDYSEPFRETNHEPELWAQFRNNWQILGLNNAVNSVGFVHQSNGQAGVQSRSWNRLYANFIFEKDGYVLSFKPWLWVSKDKSASDNPDITDFLGHGEFRAAWHRNRHVVSMMLRNQLESGFKDGAVELGWSFPVFNYPYLKGYLQYFYGYGESLIDYDNKVNRIGIGISITDWID